MLFGFTAGGEAMIATVQPLLGGPCLRDDRGGGASLPGSEGTRPTKAIELGAVPNHADSTSTRRRRLCHCEPQPA